MLPQDCRSREELTKCVQAGAHPKYVFFWGHTSHKPEVGKECLSQWYPCTFEVDGKRYASAEHFMMAEKARLFDDAENEEQILQATSPGAAKALGRSVRNFDEDTWLAHRFEIVVTASVHKFAQSSELNHYLLATKKRVLVEASPRDHIWGIGLEANDVHAQQPQNWKGLNLLGFALMEARQRLLAGAEG